MKKKQIIASALSLLFLGIVASFFNLFLRYHEHRANEINWQFTDPLFNWIPAADVSVYIFSVTYGSLLIYIFTQYKHKHFIEYAAYAYGFLILFRMISLTVVPLDAPDSFILLEDPFLNNLIYPGVIQNDLFFSGHVGLLAIFLFISRKWYFLVLMLVLGLLVVIQRVHYSIDVIAAIPIAYFIVRFTKFLVSKMEWKSN